MTAPTQAQIEAAAKVLCADDENAYFPAYCEKAAAALTAAAQVNEPTPLEQLKSRIDTRLNDYLCEMKEGYDDSITGFNEAWDIVRKVFAEAAIRKLKDKPAIDPNIVYPGKDPDFVFPEEGP